MINDTISSSANTLGPDELTGRYLTLVGQTAQQADTELNGEITNTYLPTETVVCAAAFAVGHTLMEKGIVVNPNDQDELRSVYARQALLRNSGRHPHVRHTVSMVRPAQYDGIAQALQANPRITRPLLAEETESTNVRAGERCELEPKYVGPNPVHVENLFKAGLSFGWRTVADASRNIAVMDRIVFDDRNLIAEKYAEITKRVDPSLKEYYGLGTIVGALIGDNHETIYPVRMANTFWHRYLLMFRHTATPKLIAAVCTLPGQTNPDLTILQESIEFVRNFHAELARTNPSSPYTKYVAKVIGSVERKRKLLIQKDLVGTDMKTRGKRAYARFMLSL